MTITGAEGGTLSSAYSKWWKDYTDPTQTRTSWQTKVGPHLADVELWCPWFRERLTQRLGEHFEHVLLLAYLFLSFILGPGRLAVFLAQGFLLLVVQQRVVFMVAHDLVLIVLQKLSQNGILQQRWKRKDRKVKINREKRKVESHTSLLHNKLFFVNYWLTVNKNCSTCELQNVLSSDNVNSLYCNFCFNSQAYGLRLNH